MCQEYLHSSETIGSFTVNTINDIATVFIYITVEQLKIAEYKIGVKLIDNFTSVVNKLGIAEQIEKMEHDIADNGVPYIICFTIQKISLGIIREQFCVKIIDMMELLSKPLLALIGDKIGQKIGLE